MVLKEKILFSKKECESIISNVSGNIANFNSKDRKYNSQPIKYSVKNEWLFNKLKYFFENTTGLYIIKNKEEIHFHTFKSDYWFGKHNDNKDGRLYAIGVLLNDNFDGGDFKLYNPNEIILNKTAGNTYIFDVRIEHEIKPIKNGERYSLLWFIESKHISIKTDKLI